MEPPTSDKILFINSDILIHLMPSKCGILNLGISHKIFPTLPRLFLHQYVSTLLSFLTQCFPNTLPTYLGVLCGCVVCGCLFVWLCGSWLCVWWHQCGRAIVVHCVWPGGQTIGVEESWYQASALIRPQRRLTAGH